MTEANLLAFGHFNRRQLGSSAQHHHIFEAEAVALLAQLGNVNQILDRLRRRAITIFELAQNLVELRSGGLSPACRRELVICLESQALAVDIFHWDVRIDAEF